MIEKNYKNYKKKVGVPNRQTPGMKIKPGVYSKGSDTRTFVRDYFFFAAAFLTGFFAGAFFAAGFLTGFFAGAFFFTTFFAAFFGGIFYSIP